jgi:hypothetical protein
MNQTAAASMGLSTESRPIDIGRCFSDAMRVYWKNFWALVLVQFLFTVLVICSVGVLAGPLTGGYTILAIRALRRGDHRVDLGDLFRAFHRFGGLIVLFVIYSLATLLGYALLIVPGLLLTTLWGFAYAMVVDHGMSIFEAMGASWRAVMRRGLGALVALNLIVLIMLLPTWIPYIGFLFMLPLVPLAMLVLLAAYERAVDGTFCLTCDYDLRGTLVAGGERCPECGVPVPRGRIGRQA